jgi:chromosome segregation ATPase
MEERLEKRERERLSLMMRLEAHGEEIVGFFDFLKGYGQVLELTREILVEVSEINKQQKKIDMKLSELAGSLNEVGDKLDKAQAEILDAIAKLQATDPDISPEGQDSVQRLKSVADALDAIVPDNPTAPPEGQSRRLGRDPEAERAERQRSAAVERQEKEKGKEKH